MGAFRRVALGLSILVLALATQMMPALGASTATSFQSSGLSASYTRFPADFSLPQIQISISDSTSVFKPAAGPPTSTHTSQAFVSVFDVSGFEQGCFLLTPTDFSISPDLSSASLHLTIDANTPTCNGPSSFVDTQTVDVVWTAAGPVSSSQTVGTSSCGTYHTETTSSRSGRLAAATATISPLLTQPYDADSARIDTGGRNQHQEGVQAGLCEVQPVLGPAPGLAAGSYQSMSTGASQQLSDDAAGTFLSVFASTITNSSNPAVGPSTSTTETTVRLNLFGTTGGSGCFVVSDPSVFVLPRDVSGASLQVTVTDQTATCGGQPNTLPTPLTIDVTWTGLGPSSTSHGVTHSACAGYIVDGTGSLANNVTSAVATLSGGINESFVSHQSEHESSGGIGWQETATHVVGTIPSGCA